MSMRSRLGGLVAAGFALALAGGASAQQQDLTLYTSREEGLIRPLLDTFTQRTGIRVRTLFLTTGLAERVAAEGANSPADVLMAVDVGNLVDFVDKGVTQPVSSPVLEAAIPANLRDPAGNWFSLSLRARIVYASKDRVTERAMRYEDLADPKWRGKVCIRSGQHPYNTALVAAMIAKSGEAQTEAWLRGVKANLARRPAGGDREVARDILGGICDVGLANSYYVGLMRSGTGGPDQKRWGDAINLVLPTFGTGATHVNVSGAAVAKNAPNRANAIRLLEFLVSDEAQEIYAKANFEYPVKAGVKSDPIIAELGTLRVDDLRLGDIAAKRRAASNLIDKVGFDN
jgi:iron(III) transport system substrate-binding protein